MRTPVNKFDEKMSGIISKRENFATFLSERDSTTSASTGEREEFCRRLLLTRVAHDECCAWLQLVINIKSRQQQGEACVHVLRLASNSEWMVGHACLLWRRRGCCYHSSRESAAVNTSLAEVEQHEAGPEAAGDRLGHVRGHPRPPPPGRSRLLLLQRLRAGIR